MSGLTVLLLSIPDGRAAPHTADCDADPNALVAEMEFVNGGDTVTIIGACALGPSPFVIDELGPVTFEGDGLLARCLQHETDHTLGIVFADRLPTKAQKKLRKIQAKVADDFPPGWPA